MAFRAFKRWISCMLILVLVFATAACGKTEQSKEIEDSQQTQSADASGESVLVFCGAGLKKPMDEIGAAFEEKTGTKVQYTYAGSGQNLVQMVLTGKGDVFVPGAMSFYDEAKEKGIVDSKQDIVYHIPVIIVPKGNPAGIKTLEDMAKPGVKVVLGDPDAAAIGKVSDKLFESIGVSQGIATNTVATTPTVNELVTYVSMGQADASIVWEDNAIGVSDVEAIEIPKEQNSIKTVPISLVSASQNKEAAQEFIDFVVSDEGKSIYKKYGFKPVE